MSDKTLVLDERAVSTIAAMNDHVAALGRYYGDTSTQYTKAAVSLGNALATLMLTGFGDTARVYRDGDLSLYVREGGFAYGLVFHTVHRECTVCGAQLSHTGQVRYHRDGEERCADGAHVPDYDYDAPSPGTWSMHS